MARTIAMLRPLCFAKWDRYFYFSGQQWLRKALDTLAPLCRHDSKGASTHSCLRVISSHNREVEHVPAYSHSNRWVGVGGACSDAWIVAGEIRRGQGNRHYRQRLGCIPSKSRNTLRACWIARPMRPSRPVCPAIRFMCKTYNPMTPSLQRPRTGAAISSSWHPTDAAGYPQLCLAA